MNYNNQIRKGVPGIVRYSCDAFFFLFSFCFLYFLQGDLLSAAQYVLSGGLTQYSIFAGAVILPILLLVLKWVVSIVLPKSRKFYAVLYFPSFLALALITDVDRSNLLSGTFSSLGIWISLCLLILFVVVVFALKLVEDSFEDDKVGLAEWSTLWINYSILLAMIIFCGSYQDCPEELHYELKAEHHMLSGETDEALSVAEKDDETTRRLTELRMCALAHQGKLTTRLFDYPQLYGGEGLLSVGDKAPYYRYTPEHICLWLGAIPDYQTVRTTKHFLQVMNREDSLRTPTTQDYELCYDLLEKDIKSFAEKFQLYYPADGISEPLPKVYAEALIYIYNVDSTLIPAKYPIPKETENLYTSFLVREKELKEQLIRQNYLRKEFGHTFWYYIIYSDKKKRS